MAKLAEYYADRIRSALPSGEANGITKKELMKRMSITDAQLMDSILDDVDSSISICCKNGRYFVQNEVSAKDVRDFIKANFTLRDGVEHRMG